MKKLKSTSKVSKSPRKRNTKKTLEHKLDAIFSLLIRRTCQCERCGKGTNLQCSHIHTRTKMSVRWDLKNAFCLCAGCHKYWWHQNPILAAEFTRKKLGEEEYDALNYRAETIKRWTLEEMQFLYAEFKKDFEK